MHHDRFPKIDFNVPMTENNAFLLTENGLKDKFVARYQKTTALYYNGQPPFEKLLSMMDKKL